MGPQTYLTLEFVELAPAQLKDSVLYVSMVHSCVIHRCCCGCGEKVVTPLSPGEWQLSFDGEAISLHPSIGNSRFRCRSHYWIRQGQVIWVPTLSPAETETARKWGRAARDAHFNSRRPEAVVPAPSVPTKKSGLLQRVWDGLTVHS